MGERLYLYLRVSMVHRVNAKTMIQPCTEVSYTKYKTGCILRITYYLACCLLYRELLSYPIMLDGFISGRIKWKAKEEKKSPFYICTQYLVYMTLHEQ